VIEVSDLRQDLNQVLGSQLAGSTAGRNERRQAHLVHVSSQKKANISMT